MVQRGRVGREEGKVSEGGWREGGRIRKGGREGRGGGGGGRKVQERRETGREREEERKDRRRLFRNIVRKVQASGFQKGAKLLILNDICLSILHVNTKMSKF